MTRRFLIPPRLRPPSVRSAIVVAFASGDSIATLARRYRVGQLVIERILRNMV